MRFSAKKQKKPEPFVPEKRPIELDSYFEEPSKEHLRLGKVAKTLFSLGYDVQVSGQDRISSLDGPLVVATGPHNSALDVGYPMLVEELWERFPDTAVVVKENLQDHWAIGRLQHIPAYRDKATLELGEPKDRYLLNEQECGVLGFYFDPENPIVMTEAGDVRKNLLMTNTVWPTSKWLKRPGKKSTVLLSVEGTRYPADELPEGFEPERYSRLEISKMYDGAASFARLGGAKLVPVYTQVLPERGSFGRKVLAVRIGYPIEPGKDRERDTEEVRYQLLALQNGLFENGVFSGYQSFRDFSDWAFQENGGAPKKSSATWKPFSERLSEYQRNL